MPIFKFLVHSIWIFKQKIENELGLWRIAVFLQGLTGSSSLLTKISKFRIGIKEWISMYIHIKGLGSRCTVMSLLEAPYLIEAPPQVSLHIVME